MGGRAGLWGLPGPGPLPGKLIKELRAFAVRHFELATPSQDGESTTGAHLRQLQQHISTPKEVKERETSKDEAPPRALSSQWSIFCDLSRRRTPGFSGPSPITDQGLEAWQRNHRTRLEIWEIALIFDLDDLYRESVNDRSSDT